MENIRSKMLQAVVSKIPYGTTPPSDYRGVAVNACAEIAQQEIDALKKKYETSGADRINNQY